MTSAIRLKDVYRTVGGEEILYRLMAERERKVNISHRMMPSWSAHRKFVGSRPYKGWYFILSDGETVGAIYLSKADEIGLFLFRKHQGRKLGGEALEALMKKFPRVRRFLANINPANSRSIRFFERRGFRHIQNTYELRRKA